MSEKLQIPTAVQELLDSINATKLNLGEIKIDKHPLVSQDLDRYIQINKISIDLTLPRTYIWYSQVLKDSESNIDKHVHTGGSTLTGTFAIIRRGSIFTLVGASSAAIRINTKTSGTYGMSLYMANSNTLSAAESSMSVINAYYIN